jgi:hypothetical protein
MNRENPGLGLAASQFWIFWSFPSFSISAAWLRMFCTGADSLGSVSAVHLSLTFFIPQIASLTSPRASLRDLRRNRLAGGYQGHLANSTFSF